MRRLLKEKRGEGFVDVCVLVLSVALVLALVVRTSSSANTSRFCFATNTGAMRTTSARTSVTDSGDQWAGRFRHQLKSGGSPGGNRT